MKILNEEYFRSSQWEKDEFETTYVDRINVSRNHMKWRINSLDDLYLYLNGGHIDGKFTSIDPIAFNEVNNFRCIYLS